MHEMSIAMGILDIANEYALKSKAKVVNEIEIEIGTLAGVEFSSLEFAMDAVSKGTILENAKTKILRIEAKAKCNVCNAEFPIANFFMSCPKCNSYNITIINGKELRVKALNVD